MNNIHRISVRQINLTEENSSTSQVIKYLKEANTFNLLLKRCVC